MFAFRPENAGFMCWQSGPTAIACVRSASQQSQSLRKAWTARRDTKHGCFLPAESDTEAAEDAKKYSTFWKEFGKAIKLGIIEDVQNRQRLAKLMRFETSKSGSKEIGLDAYIANMKEGQKSIYYLAGQHRAANLPYKTSILYCAATAAAISAAAAVTALGVALCGLPSCLPASCLLAAVVVDALVLLCMVCHFACQLLVFLLLLLSMLLVLLCMIFHLDCQLLDLLLLLLLLLVLLCMVCHLACQLLVFLLLLLLMLWVLLCMV